ncbi:hypothetical protein [Chitinophaga sp. Cy-1792]|uniref:hypothetical protein n=1 Tax=Chitinophaga sp. Cy-1792 TaxID=2608339 RepID=UPI0014207F5E|nr:hypothetical protein [Chitinophaga sp. Cy-1792]NIG54186.1 hypothetical protein [Chitinophaga sp. Cy-1792]
MKKHFKMAGSVLLVISLYALPVKSQVKTYGIYSTISDYLNNRPSYGPDSLHSGSLYLHDFISKPYISLKYNGNTRQIPKTEIYAFTGANGTVYRLQDNNRYEVLNKNGQLQLYRRKQQHTGKDLYTEKYDYYFSARGGNIQPLTTWNVKRAFPEHKELADKIDINFRQDNELCVFDTYHGMYKLEWLLQ